MKYVILFLMSGICISPSGCFPSGCSNINTSYRQKPPKIQGDIQHLYLLNTFNEAYIHATIVKDSFLVQGSVGNGRLSWKDLSGEYHTFVLSHQTLVYIGQQVDFVHSSNYVDLDK